MYWSSVSAIFVMVKRGSTPNSWHHPCQSTFSLQSLLSRSPCRYVEQYTTDRSRSTHAMHPQLADQAHRKLTTDQSIMSVTSTEVRFTLPSFVILNVYFRISSRLTSPLASSPAFSDIILVRLIDVSCSRNKLPDWNHPMLSHCYN